MKQLIGGPSRDQAKLFPEYPQDWIDESNAVRVVEAYVESLDHRLQRHLQRDYQTGGIHPIDLRSFRWCE